jgi:hypothetical protein
MFSTCHALICSEYPYNSEIKSMVSDAEFLYENCENMKKNLHHASPVAPNMCHLTRHMSVELLLLQVCIN